MVIYKQALQKYLKAPSTWIILVIALFISGFLAGYLPFMSKGGEGHAAKYGYNVLMATGVVTTMISIFSSIFAGFKGASMFRDEIESGTFLILVSKPISRTKIIMEKWLALQTIMIAFAIFNVAVFEIVVSASDNYSSLPFVATYGVSSLSKNLFVAGGYMLLVLLVMGLIFSSIAMILSTKLSGATTIGISIGIGVIIPITGMVGAFTHKPEYKVADDYGASKYNMIFEKYLSEDTDSTHTSTIRNIYKQTEELFKAMEDPNKGFFKIAIATGEKDKFSKYFPADLSYQLTTMGALATEKTVPIEYKANVGKLGIMSELAPIIKVIRDNRFDYSKWSTPDKAIDDVFTKLVTETKAVLTIGHELKQFLVDNGIIKVTQTTNPGAAYKPEDEVWISTDMKASEAVVNLISMAEDMARSPLSFLFDSKTLIKAQKDEWSHVIPKTENDFVSAVNAESSIKGFQLDSSSKDIYTELMYILLNDRSELIYARPGNYEDPRTLLWIYFGIAMGLVPISLLIMRKKDFR